MIKSIIEEREKHEKRMMELEVKQMKSEEKAAKKKLKPRINTSKAGLWYMMIMCTIIQFYSMAAMWYFQDLSPLTTLIGATVGEVFAYWGYALKASKENCEGGITYEMALRDEPKG